jgi:hypothetical protein
MDSDAHRPLVMAAATDGGSADTGADSGLFVYYNNYESACPQGYRPLWRWFDFQTKTPKDSAVLFSAQSAAATADLATAPSVDLAKVTGPDITVWTGVDVDPKLRSIGEQSLRYLRVKTTLVAASDMTLPTVTNTRQQYDCIAAQ